MNQDKFNQLRKTLNLIGFFTVGLALWWGCLIPFLTADKPVVAKEKILYEILTGIGAFYTSFRIWSKLEERSG